MKPVELEILMRDKTREAWKSVQYGARKTGETVKQEASDFQKRMQEQSAVIKQVEADIRELKKQLEKLSPDKAKMDLTAELEEAKKVLEEEKIALAELGNQFEATAKKEATLRTQIMNQKQVMAGMAEGTEKYYEAMRKLGELQDRYSDITQQATVFADDDKEIKEAMEAVAGLSGAMATGVGIATLFGAEEEKLVEIQTKLQAVITITMGIQQMANALNKDSYVQHVLLTKAKTFLTTANIRLATSLGISNAAAQALMATLTLGLSVVITGLVVAWNRYSDAQAESAAKSKELLEMESEGRSTMIKTRHEIQTTLQTLKEFSGTKAQEKKKVEELNRKYGETFGYYNTIAQWYDVLQQKGDAYIRMLFLQAKAQSIVQKAVEEDKKLNELKETPDSEVEGAMGFFSRSLLHLADSETGGQFNSRQLIREHNRKAKEEAIKKQQEVVNELLNEAMTIQQEAADVALNNNIGTFSPAKPETEKVEKVDKAALMEGLGEAELKARRKIEDMQLQLMKEGAAKRKAEAKQLLKQEIDRIDQEERERLKAMKDAKKKGLTVTPGQVDTVKSQAAKQRELAASAYAQKIVKIETENIEQLIQGYRDYAGKRIDIEQKFNQDISALIEARNLAEAQGNTSRISELNRAIAQATAEKGRELMRVDFDKLKESPDYIRAFENLRDTSNDTLNSLLAQLDRAKATAAEVLSPDQLREYTTTIQEIMDELDARNPFQALSERKWELAEAEKELAEAKRQMEIVQAGGKIVTETKLNEQTGKIEADYLSAAHAAENYNRAQDKVARAASRVRDAEKKVSDVVRDLSARMRELGGIIGGQAGEIISLIGEIGAFAMTAMSGVTAASQTASTAVQAVEKASVILAIIGAAIQIATKIANMFKDDDGMAAYERAKEVYESYIAILDKVIAKQKELFSLNSQTGEQAYEMAVQKVQDKSRIARELGKQWADAGASKGFLGFGSKASQGVRQRDNISHEAWEEAANVLGLSVDGFRSSLGGRMERLFELPVDQLSRLRDNAQLFFAELTDEARDYLNTIIDAEEEILKLNDERNEKLLYTGFDDFRDGYFDLLKDLDSGAVDFADRFEEHLRNAILSSLITDKYQERIKKLYQHWAEATKSENSVDKLEVEWLRKEQENIAADILRERESLMKDLGLQADASLQSGRSGTFTAMSAEQGTKLEGLFTSAQDHLSGIDQKLDSLTASFDRAMVMLNIIAVNTGYCKLLEDIVEYFEKIERNGIKTRD